VVEASCCSLQRYWQRYVVGADIGDIGEALD
jgi:hypothetical protein